MRSNERYWRLAGNPDVTTGVRTPLRTPALLAGLAATWFVVAGCAGTTITTADLAREYFNLGNAFFELGDLERSYVYYQRALELSTALPAASYNLARLYVERERYDDALKVLEELAVADPDNALLMETEAYALFRAGRRAEALERYRVLLARYPARVSARYNAAVILRDEEQFVEAYNMLEPAVVLVPQDGELLWLLGELAFGADLLEEALRAAELHLAIAESDPAQLMRLARRYVEWGYDLPALDPLLSLASNRDHGAEAGYYLALVHFRSMQEFDLGLRFLKESLAAGYNDLSRLADLRAYLTEEELVFVTTAYAEAGLVVPTNGTDDNAGGDDTAVTEP